MIYIILRQETLRLLSLFSKALNLYVYEYFWIKFSVFTEMAWKVLYVMWCRVICFRNWPTFLRKVIPPSYNLKMKVELSFKSR
jgi:hypothetical protein